MDELKQQLMTRGLLGGKDAKIGPKPEPSGLRKALEMLTGYPADPERELGPMDAIQMMLLGAGAAKGAQIGYQKLIGGPSAKAGDAIRLDPYGLREGPVGRRPFIDQLLGNDIRRAEGDIPRLNTELGKIGNTFRIHDPASPYGPKPLPSGRAGTIRKYAPGEKSLLNRLWSADEMVVSSQGGGDLFDIDTQVPGPISRMVEALTKRFPSQPIQLPPNEVKAALWSAKASAPPSAEGLASATMKDLEKRFGWAPHKKPPR